MNYKSLVILATALLSNICMLSQNSLSFQYLGRVSSLRGGFENTWPSNDLNGALSIAFDRRDSCRLGYSVHLSSGLKSFEQHYPVYVGYWDFETEKPVFSLYENVKPVMGVTFRYYELFTGATFFHKRFIRLKLGPYLSYNIPIYGSGKSHIDPNYYYPFSGDKLYRKMELGAQLHLALNLSLGKHFFLSANGMFATSLLDLRKNDWEDAYQRVPIFGSMEHSGLYPLHMESRRAVGLMYSAGVGIGWTW